MKKLNIYVIDDEKPILDMFEEFFTILGHNIKCNASSYDAFEDIINNDTEYDIVLSDIFMKKPDYNGIEFSEKLLEKKPDLPVILITGYARFQNINLPANVKDVFLKPFQLRKVAERVMELVEG